MVKIVIGILNVASIELNASCIFSYLILTK